MLATIARRLPTIIGIAISAVMLWTASFGTAFAEPALADPSVFTNRVAAAFAKTLPGSNVAVVSPLYLKVTMPDHGQQMAYLDNLYRQCGTTPDRCDDLIAVWVQQVSSAAGGKIDSRIDVATLRIVVRPKSYVDQIRLSQKQEPIAAPFVADLWMICVADLPQAIEYPPASKFEAAGLSRDAALSICKNNTAARFSPAPKPKKHKAISVLTDDPYASSRLLVPETWAALVKKSHGQLIVSVPGTDMVLYTEETDPASIEVLRNMTRDAVAHVTRPVSLAVFRWTPNGFEEVK